MMTKMTMTFFVIHFGNVFVDYVQTLGNISVKNNHDAL